MKYYVYLIKSIERYTGMTEDLDLRLKQHNKRTLSFWTKRGSNWQLIYSEEEALKRERWMKSGHGKKFLNEKGL